ncbi:hypothetical protein CAPTEDRAFT_205169 [Capitella teleta]|uniref:Protein quiver n=1 Tax=Capitella teleta TaxID=283909 RepID=R7U9U3_CAPTE|nr:hypothetical protein CAPTEDRAFT_205169 [Capitella teleta]|eukprot:ELT99880.1 hypothetical protein CAPTEDRAFT_205169 [Capitella teleta]
MGTNHVILLAFLACVISSVWATECYKCSDFEVEDSNPSIKKWINGKSSPACNWGLGSQTVSCASNEVCGLVKGSVEGTFLGEKDEIFRVRDILFMILLATGHFKMKTYVRDCIEAKPDGCISEMNDATNIINSVLKVAAVFGSLKIDANLCSCNFDLCNPDPCDDGDVNFFNIGWYNIVLYIQMGEWQFCSFSVQIMLLVVAGGGLFILILSCNVYCYCKKRNTTQGVVIMPGVVTSSTVLTRNTTQVDFGANDGGLVNPIYSIATNVTV